MSLALSNLNAAPPSALLLSDRLLRLAEDAQSAGCHITAEHLLALAHTVFDDLEMRAAKPYWAASAGCSARQRKAPLSSSVRVAFANGPLTRNANVGGSATAG